MGAQPPPPPQKKGNWGEAHSLEELWIWGYSHDLKSKILNVSLNLVGWLKLVKGPIYVIFKLK